MGGFSAVHQFVQIGAYAFVAAKAAVFMDLLPAVMAVGERANVLGINKVGLRRKSFSRDDISAIQKAYQIVFTQGNSKEKAIELLKGLETSCHLIDDTISSLQSSTRGIAREARDPKKELV